MSKTVVLAEKPSVGRDLARVLQCHKKGNGFLEGDKYIVTWALGHLVTLADPEAYGDHYKSWRLEDLPMLPTPLKLVVIKKTGKQFQAVKTQLLRKDVNEIVIATDAGREGELVARWIIDKARVNKPLKRLWISSVTDKAIKEGFRKLKNGKEYENLYASAVARAEADWIVGLNATRALTTKYNAQLSSGRVQTPTLAMIAQREEDIKSFKPKKYYGMKAQATNGLTLTWQDEKTKDIKTFEEAQIDQKVTKLKGKSASVVDVKTTPKKSYSPALYDLTELQRDANKRYGFSAKETLSIMQKLYEQHKVLTYPRTDSRYLTSDLVDTLKDRLAACRTKEYAQVIAKITKQPIKANKSFVDDTKVSDHHAIIPTEESVPLSALSDKEFKIYDLVVKRFLSVLLPAHQYEQTVVTAKIDDESFTAKGRRITALGWKEVFRDDTDDDHEDEQKLPALSNGDQLPIVSLSKTSGETKPPARFNEAALLSAMENPTKYMAGESKDLIKTIGETGGLGTVATRADIIEKLYSSFLIEKKGKEIFITSKGKQLLKLVPEELKSPVLTAEWEQKLTKISKGSLSKQAFLNEMTQYAKEVVHEIKNSKQSFKHDNVTGKKCPECNKLLLEVNGKMGKMLVCQDRECGYRKGVSKVTNARCPNCHKKLELRGEGEGQIFVCKCGHREKMSTFQERRKKNQNSKVSKQDVAKYMKKQDEGFANNALADALAKLNLKK
ncbi:DNA topoisomerase III [Metabacillus sediminilitoris]|uniref:DNA topoisomerase 3 n=1 Tax=Metabacillus sediminilitoris TaxID=2567941 RepID=A0A4S4BN79_9BACI|nr:DNA topoisomerase III [Metabacillus sediminilitoris]QGQ48413.1 DNA topoisomerase III [Metabacillus sediminilitoris]THF76310.1 DNA topoisomerase III [Metabacillus sediminilitoris]